MSATLKLVHKAIGAEVRRGTYDVVHHGERVGSIAMNDTFEVTIHVSRSSPGNHTDVTRECADLGIREMP